MEAASKRTTKRTAAAEAPEDGDRSIGGTSARREHKEPPQPCDPVCVHGISMGGLHAAMTVALSPFEASVVGWLAPSSAVPVFTSGIMASAIEWDTLSREARKRCVC